MNTISQLESRMQSDIDAGSLTAQWLLWGLPKRLGVAAPQSGRGTAQERIGEMTCPAREAGLTLIRTAA